MFHSSKTHAGFIVEKKGRKKTKTTKALVFLCRQDWHPPFPSHTLCHLHPEDHLSASIGPGNCKLNGTQSESASIAKAFPHCLFTPSFFCPRVLILNLADILTTPVTDTCLEI